MNEINAVCDKYAPLDAFHPETLVERLSHVPLEAWDNMGGPEGNSFPVVDMCLRETVRLHMQGAMLRRNMSGKPVVIPGTKANESIPDGALSVSLVPSEYCAQTHCASMSDAIIYRVGTLTRVV